MDDRHGNDETLARLGRLEAEKHSVRRKLDELEAQHERLRASVDESRAYRERLRAERARLASRLASALSRQRIIATQIQRLDAELRENAVERDALGTASEETNGRLQGVEEELGRAEGILERTRTTMAELQESAAKIARQMDALAESDSRSGRTLELPRQEYHPPGDKGRRTGSRAGQPIGAIRPSSERSNPISTGLSAADVALREMESILPAALIETGSVEAQTKREITEEIDVEPSGPHSLPPSESSWPGTPAPAFAGGIPESVGGAMDATPKPEPFPLGLDDPGDDPKFPWLAIAALGLLPIAAAAAYVAMGW